MIKAGTYFNVADNSGAKQILCLKNLSKKSNIFNIGDKIVGVVKSINNKNTVNYSDIVKAVIVRSKKKDKYNKIFDLSFNENSVVLIDANNNPIGTKIFGPIPKNLKKLNYLKLASLTTFLV